MNYRSKNPVRKFNVGGVPTTSRMGYGVESYDPVTYPFPSSGGAGSVGSTTNNTITVNGQDVAATEDQAYTDPYAVEESPTMMRRGGRVKSKKSKPRARGDGLAKRGKTRGRFV
jgi:hypothetical protein